MLFTGRARLGLAILALVSGLAILTAACGGGDDDDSETAAPTSEATATPLDGADGGGGETGDGEEAEAFEEVYPVNQTFWHRGFTVEIGDAIYAATEPDVFGGQDFSVTLEATFTNNGANQDSFFSTVTMITPGDTYTFNPGFGGLPNVPGGGESANGEFVFRVDEGFEIDDAYLIVGEGDEQQARVPLGPGGGELVALEPGEVVVTGAMSLSQLDLNFTGAELRADNPINHQQIEAGKLALTLNFDATSRRSGNWSIFPQDFALDLPDGASVGVDGADLPPLQGSDAGLDATGLYVRFLVDDPGEGSYVLRFTPSEFWLEQGDPAELTLEFEL